MLDSKTPVAIAPPRKHHRFGPSKMGYLSKCSAFTGKEGENDYSEEGTFLHDMTEGMVRLVLAGKFKTVLEQVQGIVTKHELSDDQSSALRFVAKKLDRLFALKPVKVITEIDTTIKRVNGKNLNHGFLDILFIFKTATGFTGIICDYKFGRIPVTPAPKNYQGKNYWVGCMQEHTELEKCGVCFIQPRLGWISEAMFTRAQLPSILNELETIVSNAEEVQRNPAQAHKLMTVGNYCDYCALAGECTALNNARGMAVARHHGLPLPPKFDGLSISQPEQLALARYWVDIIERGLGDVKTKAYEAAEANGGEISCKLPDGSTITYEVAERGHDRSLGNASEVADALQEFVSPSEILGAAELAIGKLETIVKSAMVELAKAKGEKLTKKAAWEQVTATLEACGLMTKPGGTIRYLRQKRAPEKQLTEGTK
jgi:hypothetical protein